MSEAHSTFYPMGTGALCLEVKRQEREADHFQLVPSQENVDLYIHSHLRPDGLVLSYLNKGRILPLHLIV
jgi:hypothetical protein